MDYIMTLLGPMLEGALVTTSLFAIVIVLALPFGFCITLVARCRLKPLAWIARGFIYVIRGTPLLLQLLFIYFGLPYIPGIGSYLVFDRFTAACIGFVLNYAAYFAEIFRGGLLSIDKGQYEAAQVLGISRIQTFFRVIIPQMLRVALPSLSNESVTLVKDTSLLYAVSVPEILHAAKTAVNRDVSIVPFAVAAVIYLIMNTILTLLFKYIEKKFNFDREM
ncbi:MAG: amino acid ABC transporter permease [Oscillospiraceae bacterium]|jgi:polar amino acid transport system permease protein